MLQLVPHLKILVCVEPQDFRKGIDGLSGVCRAKLDADPYSGTVFVFRNRGGTCLKLLVHDGTGFWLATRRFSRGRIAFWPTAEDARLHPLTAQELSVLLYAGNPRDARFAEPWRKLS